MPKRIIKKDSPYKHKKYSLIKNNFKLRNIYLVCFLCTYKQNLFKFFGAQFFRFLASNSKTTAGIILYMTIEFVFMYEKLSLLLFGSDYTNKKYENECTKLCILHHYQMALHLFLVMGRFLFVPACNKHNASNSIKKVENII